MVGKYRRMDDDLFGISARLKSIDEGYFVLYNYRLCRFEVHNKNQRGDSLALVVPFGRLDARTVALTQRTRAENIKRLLAEMEGDNARLDRERVRRAAESAARAAEKTGREQR